MPAKLAEISIEGFKTFKQLRFTPGSLNVLIGANGAGKSNFISFFRFLNWMLTPPGQLQVYVERNGGASAFLHDGPGETSQIRANVKIFTDMGLNEYEFRLFPVVRDEFRFAEEKYRFSSHQFESDAPWTVLNPGISEAGINGAAEGGDRTARTINRLIRRCIVHQFHNTSAVSRMKQRWTTDDNRHLKEDGGNLAPFLLRLREEQPHAYRRIVGTLRQLLPFFADFVLEAGGTNTVLLQWRETGSDVVFSSDQASDGMLRLMALLALLLQPEEDLPDVLLIDEPELGLHPQACELVAGLIRAIAKSRQVILATQSTYLVDQFAPEDIVVIDRPGRESVFCRFGKDELSDWLKDFSGGRAYTLSELWEKNLLRGSPTA